MQMDKDKTRDRMRKPETIPVVLIRHAQSQWNKENRFTSWADPVLTAQGRYEAMRAGMAA